MKEIIPLMKQDFWRGALGLFGHMADDLDFVIEWFSEYGVDPMIYETAQEMFRFRSQREKNELAKVLQIPGEFVDKELRDKLFALS